MSYTQQAFGQWGPASTEFSSSFPVADIYVDPVLGKNLNNPTGAKLNPIRTLGEAIRRAALVPGSCNIHLKRATYVLPPEGLLIDPRMLTGLVKIFADDVWDPTIWKVIEDNSGTPIEGTLALGTTSTVLVPDTPFDISATLALTGYTIEVTSGGVKRKRLIRNIESSGETPQLSAIIPDFQITQAAPGDAFRVVGSQCALVTPVGAPLADQYVFCCDCPSEMPQFPNAKRGLRLEGVVLNNLSDNYASGFYFGRAPVFMYGVELQPESVLALSFNGTFLYMGTGTGGADFDVLEGWGIGKPQSDNFPFEAQQGAWLQGYICTQGEFGFGTNYRYDSGGGAFVRIFDPGFGPNCEINLVAFGLIPTLVDARGGGSSAVACSGHFMNLQSAEIHGGGAGIQVDEGGTVYLNSAVTGGTAAGDAVFVFYGQGRVILFGEPQFGDAVATDYTVQGAAASQNKTFFNAAGQAILSLADAGVIVRNS